MCAIAGNLAPMTANAAGVTIYADLTEDTNYNGGGTITPATVTTEAEIAVSTTDEVFISWQSDSDYANGDVITIVPPSGWTFANTCGTPTTDADGDDTGDGAGAINGSNYDYTFTGATTTGASNGVEFCINVTTDASVGNEVVTMSDDRAAPDTGAVVVYNGDDNDIAVTGSVITTLFFALRNTADDGDTNACALGTLQSSSVSTCAYRVAVSTAAESGVDVYVDDTSSNAGLTANAGANNIDVVIEGDTVTAGDEEYGIAVTGATVGGTMAESGDFDDDDTSIPTSKTEILNTTGVFQYTQGNTATSTLVTHRASIDANTVAGSYTQTVSYYVTANY